MDAVRARSRRAVFVVLTLVGLSLALVGFFGLAMGECLPRDGGAAMRACDAEKQREFWLYPLFVLLSVGASVWLEVRGSRFFGGLVAALSGLIAAGGLYLIEMI